MQILSRIKQATARNSEALRAHILKRTEQVHAVCNPLRKALLRT